MEPSGTQVGASRGPVLLQSSESYILVDHLQNTAGDVALSLNNEACYTIIRDAGLRAGVLRILA